MIDIKRVNQKVVAQLPSLGRCFCQRMPPFLLAQMLTAGLNQFFVLERQNGDLDFLQHKSLTIDVQDWAFRFGISFTGNKLKADIAPAAQDLLIRASSADFLLMINNQADPDTLFFRRRLLMLGDTELGLHCKNLLDSISPERLPWPLLPVSAWLGQQIEKAQAGS